MTAAARITQADVDRAMKAAAKLERARVVLDLANARIEIIIGEPAEGKPPIGREWNDDDV